MEITDLKKDKNMHQENKKCKVPLNLIYKDLIQLKASLMRKMTQKTGKNTI